MWCCYHCGAAWRNVLVRDSQAERQLNESAEAGARPAVDEAEVAALAREFASNWRAGIQQINDDVLAYFANFRNGMEILKQVREREEWRGINRERRGDLDRGRGVLKSYKRV